MNHLEMLNWQLDGVIQESVFVFVDLKKYSKTFENLEIEKNVYIFFI